jgi:hypothetical protein
MTENPFEIPQTMCDWAEQNVRQANAAYEQLGDSVNKSVAMGLMSSEGFKNLQDRAMAFAMENAETACMFAGKVCNAKTAQEILTLQTRFVQDRMQAFVKQAPETNG